MTLTRGQKWLSGTAFAGLLVATALATGFHVRITITHMPPPSAAVSADTTAILSGMDKMNARKRFVAFLDNGYRSGGIVGDPNDGGSFGGMAPRSGGVFEQHGASAGWANQAETNTDRWGVDFDIGWDRGPVGRISGHLEHEHSVSKGGSDRDHGD